MLKQRHQFFVAMLCCVDALVVVAASYAAWVIRRVVIEHGFPPAPWQQSRWGIIDSWIREPMALIAMPITLYAMMAFGLYRPRRDRSMLAEHSQVFKAALSAVIALIVLVWALGPEVVGGWSSTIKAAFAGMTVDAARVQLGALALILPNLLALHRVLFRIALRIIRRRGWNLRHVAVIGTGRLGRITCRTLDRNSWTGIHVAYFVSHHEKNDGPKTCVNRPVKGGLSDLEEVLEREPPDAVYLAMPTSRAAMLPSILRRLERYTVDIRVIPDVQPRYMPLSMNVVMLEGMPVLTVRECPMNGFGGMVKRAIDVSGAIAALALFALPMLAIALFVHRTSPGPVIFKQRRVSLGGETFNIYKFRTMFQAEDEQSEGSASWTRRNDPRITPIGRWLRRTSFDELPQLFNVIRGEMSLVGPRPERPELTARFREDWRGYMLRQHVRAGITGWAQVNGLRGDTSLKKRLQHDLFYIRNWSLGFDLKILWLTLFRGFVHRNAH